MLNREAGESPARSRRCDVERVLFIPLEGVLWEGETREEAKPEELPVRCIVV